MDLLHLEENGTRGLMPGSYKIVAIGPGGDGANGNKSTGSNSAQYGTVDGADGAAGGAGGYVYVNTITLENMATLGVTVSDTETSILINDFFTGESVLNLSIPKAENANGVIPGNSVGNETYSGSRGGGAGGPMGRRGSTNIPAAVPGGTGDYGDGEPSTPGSMQTTNTYSAALGGKGGNNPGNSISTGNLVWGKGGIGAKDNGLEITAENIASITVQDVATKINGGNGTDGSTPSSRPAVTGMPGTSGSGGGGAWLSGTDGTPSGSPSAGVNGDGGVAGIGGKGCVWIKDIVVS